MFSFLDGDQLRQSGMVLQALVSHATFCIIIIIIIIIIMVLEVETLFSTTQGGSSFFLTKLVV